MESCKNCENELNEGDKFCSNCGQKTIDRITLRTLLGELAATFFAWDSKLFKTLKLLLFRPGRIAKNYKDGKRKGYVAPLRMYIFFSVAFFFMVATLPKLISPESETMDGDLNITFNGQSVTMDKDSLLLLQQHDRLDEVDFVREQEEGLWKKFAIQVIKMELDRPGFDRTLRNNFSIMLFLFIPIIALTLKVSFWNNDYDYIEHLIYGLYFHSFMFFVLIISLFFSRLLDDAWPLIPGVILIMIYLFIGLKHFYERSWLRMITKFLGVTTIYLLLSAIFIILTIAVTIYTF